MRTCERLEDWSHLEEASMKLSEYWRWWCIAELDRAICLPTTFIFVSNSPSLYRLRWPYKAPIHFMYQWEKASERSCCCSSDGGWKMFFSFSRTFSFPVFALNKKTERARDRERFWNFEKERVGWGSRFEVRYRDDERTKRMNGGDTCRLFKPSIASSG